MAMAQSKGITFISTHKFLNTLFSEDVHAKRIYSLEHLPKRLNRGIPLRERIGFKVRTGMEASMDGETVFGGSAWARCWCGARWRYHPGNCGATWSEYQLCRALP